MRDAGNFRTFSTKRPSSSSAACSTVLPQAAVFGKLDWAAARSAAFASPLAAVSWDSAAMWAAAAVGLNPNLSTACSRSVLLDGYVQSVLPGPALSPTSLMQTCSHYVQTVQAVHAVVQNISANIIA